MTTAAVKFTQGANIGAAGQALIGVVGQAVTVGNGDDTGVSTHLYELLSSPITSALAVGTLGTGTTASFTPDVTGSYRVRVTVTGTAPSPSSDIRVFSVANSRGWIIPAFGGRTSEHNYSAQLRGWSGTDTIVLMDGILADTASILDIVTGGTAVGQVLINTTGNVPAWGAVDLADADATTGTLAINRLASLPGLSVLGRSASSTGSMAAITGTSDLVLAVNTGGTALAFGQVQTAGIANSAVTLAKLANSTASSVLGKATIGSGPYADITANATGQVLRVDNLGVIGWGAVDLADADAVTGLLPFGNLANLAGLSVLGRSGSTSGVVAAITGTSDQVLVVNTAGTSLAFGQVQTGGIANGAVTLIKLNNATAASVLGRASTIAGTYADIVSTADGQVLRRAAGIPSFGAVDLADTDAVTGLLPFGNIASGSALSVFGRSGNTVGVMASIAASAADQVLAVNTAGTALAFGQVQTAGIATGAVTLPKLANGTAESVLGRAFATSGVYADILSSAEGQVLRRGGGLIGFGAVDLADLDAVTGLLAVTNIAPSGTNGRVLTTVLGAATWGTSLGNSVDNFNITGGVVFAGGTTGFFFEANSGAMLSGKDLGSGRRVLGILKNVTTTEMPANTGDQVAFWADAVTMWTTGFPTGGGIIGLSPTLGLNWKGKNGVETTLAQTGPSGNTTKRKIIEWKTQPVETTTAIGDPQFTAASVDVSTISGYSIGAATFVVRGRCVTCSSVATYAVYTEILALYQYAGGVLTLVDSVKPGFNDSDGVLQVGIGFTATIDFSGTTIRLRLWQQNGVSGKHLAWLEICATEL